MRSVLVVVLGSSMVLLLQGGVARAQCSLNSDSGNTYRLMLPEGIHNAATGARQPGVLAVMSDIATSVGITLPAVCGTVASWCPVAPTPPGVCLVPVSPANPALVKVCTAAQPVGTGVFANQSISVVGPAAPVPPLHVVMKFNDVASFSDDAYLAIGTHAFTSKSRALGYLGASFHASRYAVIADQFIMNLLTEDCAGFAILRTLNAGDIFQQVCSPDVTGRRVVTAGGEKFAMVSGATAAYVPAGVNYADVLMDMLPPLDVDVTSFWPGSDYLTTEFNKKTNTPVSGDVFRIMALETTVTITDIDVAAGGSVAPETRGKPCSATPFTLPAGGYCDVLIGSTIAGQHHGGRIRSSPPYGDKFMVAHLMRGASQTNSGDPSMQLLVPAERFRCAHRFFSFSGFDFDPLDMARIDGSYVAIVAPATIIDTGVFLDGVALGASCVGAPAEALPFSPYSWRFCRLANPCTGATPPASCPFGEEHTITAAEGIGVYAYGQRSIETGAYAYATGFTIPN